MRTLATLVFVGLMTASPQPKVAECIATPTLTTIASETMRGRILSEATPTATAIAAPSAVPSATATTTATTVLFESLSADLIGLLAGLLIGIFIAIPIVLHRRRQLRDSA